MTPSSSRRSGPPAHASAAVGSAAPNGTPLQDMAADGPMMFDAAAMFAEARRMHQAMLAGWAMDVLVLRRRRALRPRWFAGGMSSLDDELAEPRRLAA